MQKKKEISAQQLAAINAEVATIKKLQECNIFRRSTLCISCAKPPFELYPRLSRDKYVVSWRCRCGQYLEVRDQSFFAHSKLPLRHLSLLIQVYIHTLIN